ncbi:Os03g0605350 [Oryza sativa Japonica Group]|uniref:Os03g0605350 protein n=1 Tax=Oryza sativa subsp. japonica TaxID=39947 RepID=A0A0P0W014_ORYSJ|nr:Os03g0605350 [Oryza sativa Japonica Group]
MAAMSRASRAVSRAEKPWSTVSYAYSIFPAPDTERSDAPYHSPWSSPYSAGIADFAMWTMYVALSSAATTTAAIATATATSSSLIMAVV